MTDNILTPRHVALDLLGAVLHRHHPLDEALDGDAPFNRLDQRDRAFARNLVSTALRRLGQVDDLISRCIERPLPDKARLVTDILRLGAVQLLFTRVASHGAVDSSVRLCKERGFGSHAKLVNAVLRRLDRDGAKMLQAQDPPRFNTPDWLWQSWSSAYGEDICRAIASAHLDEPPLDVTVASDAELWAERLGAQVLPTGSLRLPSQAGAVPSLAGFEQGAWWIQDAAAAIPARLLGDLAGKSVIDLCAAPGGKTAQLAAAGANVTAIERSAKRLERLQENLRRLNLSVTTVTADATQWRPDQLADAVLLDAPCTATGTIRRHPDLPYVKAELGLQPVLDLQKQMLARSANWLKPAGTMVYCTCSLLPVEGEDQVAEFLKSHPDFEQIAVTPENHGLQPDWIDTNGAMRLRPDFWADRGGMDGFYAAILKKRA